MGYSKPSSGTEVREEGPVGREEAGGEGRPRTHGESGMSWEVQGGERGVPFWTMGKTSRLAGHAWQWSSREGDLHISGEGLLSETGCPDVCQGWLDLPKMSVQGKVSHLVMPYCWLTPGSPSDWLGPKYISASKRSISFLLLAVAKTNKAVFLKIQLTSESYEKCRFPKSHP